MVSLFLLLPESEPLFKWGQRNDEFQDENKIVTFIKQLSEIIDSISIENYNGFYDNENIKSFLVDFDLLEDCYPNPAFRRLTSILYAWDNWRDEIQQKENFEYYLYGQKVSNHTFCECAQISFDSPSVKTGVLNHYGHVLNSRISIILNGQGIVIPSMANQIEVADWFAQERIPQRQFHVIPKHGENREDIRIIHNERISPLMCSRDRAQELLYFAIGITIAELFNFDEMHDCFIVFKHEGNNPQNLYHGFHLPKDTIEIPELIKTKLIKI